jgi:hypothetical protein
VNPCLGSVAYLKLAHQGIVDLAAHRCENTLLDDGSIQNLLDRNSAWDANYVRLFNVYHCPSECEYSPSLAIAEYPPGSGLPYSQRVESLVCLVPSFSSTSNLCCRLRGVSITLSENTTCKPSGNCTQDSVLAGQSCRNRKLSTYITRSRSPSPNCIFFSRVAQMVSSGFPLGMTFNPKVSVATF